MSEFSTIPPVLSFTSTAAVLITAWLAAASDWKHWRIPNQLLAASMAAALMFSMFTPDSLTLRDCLLGGVTGLVILMPFYLMGGMGAGDVKLLGVLGMHMGWLATLHVALISALVGGVWAIVLLFMRSPYGDWMSTIAGDYLRPRGRLPAPIMTRESRATLPYGVVIAIGSTFVLIAIETYPYR
jgi:prepilin peptidase CpaA